MTPDNALINALLKDSQRKYAPGSTVTYSVLDKNWFDQKTFPDPNDSAKYPLGTRDPDYIRDLNNSTEGSGRRNSFDPATSGQLKAIEDAVKAWEKLINIHFVYTNNPDNADIQFGFGDLSVMVNSVTKQIGGVAGYATPAGIERQNTATNPSPTYQAIIIDKREDPGGNGNGKNAAFNELGITLMHEIGHALGLQHPSDTYIGGQASSGLQEDNVVDTLMSYIGRASGTAYELQNQREGYGSVLLGPLSGVRTLTPQRYDIAALQSSGWYGPNPNTGAGTTIYKSEFIDWQAGGSGTPYFTIYDHDGSDTIDASAMTNSVRINLEPGAASSIGNRYGDNNVCIAFGTWIENAIGGAGNDIIFGNERPNELSGNGGQDTLYGLAGNDKLIGGDNNDILEGGKDDDILEGGEGYDTYIWRTGDGNDLIRDLDGRGAIVINPGPGEVVHDLAIVGLFAPVSGQANTWINDQGIIIKYAGQGFRDSSNTLKIQTGDGSEISIQDFQNGEFGICLVPTQADINTTRDIIGDRRPVEPRQYDDLSNPITSGDAPGRDDTLNDSTGSDRIRSLGGNDYVRAWQGGDDIIEGGAGFDILHDTSGNNRLYADTETSLEQAVLLGNTTPTASSSDPWNLSNANSEVLAGGSGNDLMVGSATSDLILTGGGHNTVVSGAGHDIILCAQDIVTLSPIWRMNYTIGSANSLGIPTLWLSDEGISTDYSAGESDPARTSNTIYAGSGRDYISGSPVADIIDAGSDDDIVKGNGGDDILFGQAGNDILIGHSGNLYIDGGDGDDRLFARFGNDTLFGGNGNDILHGDVVISADITNTGQHGSDFLDGGDGNDQLFGYGGNDILLGGAGTDTLDGGIGDDFLEGNAGNDTLKGGAGFDIYGFNSADWQNGDLDQIIDSDGQGALVVDGVALVSEDLEAVADNRWLRGSTQLTLDGTQLTLRALGASGTPSNGKATIDNFSNGQFGLILPPYVPRQNQTPAINTTAANQSGQAGTAFTYTLPATLFTDPDGDTLTYSVKLANGDALPSWLTFNADTRTLSGTPTESDIGNLSLKVTVTDSGGLTAAQTFGLAIETAASGEYHLITGTPGPDTLTGTAAADRILGLGNNDLLYGQGGNDRLEGDDGDDTLDGGDGNDLLYGGAGNDYLFGLDGDDTLDGGDGHDLLVGGEGNDYLFGLAGNDHLEGGNGNDLLDGGDGDDFLFGQAGDYDHLLGGNGNDRLEGGDGIDRLEGGNGNDTLDGGEGNDELLGEAGDDYLFGQAGNDIMNGGSGHDVLLGGAGDDILDGAEGNDFLYGQTGNDIYRGGNGNDTYRFNLGDGQDTIGIVYDTRPGRLSTLEFNPGILPGNIRLARDGDNLIITYDQGDDRITVQDLFRDNNPGNPGNPVQHLQFADGTVYDTRKIEQLLGLSPTVTGATITQAGTSGNDTLTGTAERDVLYGDAGNDRLIGGAGNDILIGGGGSDTYVFGRGDGQDTLCNYDMTDNRNDVLEFGSGIDKSQLWFRRQGSDLEVSIVGTQDTATIRNWYIDESHRLDSFKVSSGLALLENQVDQLVSAMAAFDPPAAGQTSLPPNYQDALNAVIAAGWK